MAGQARQAAIWMEWKKAKRVGLNSSIVETPHHHQKALTESGGGDEQNSLRLSLPPPVCERQNQGKRKYSTQVLHSMEKDIFNPNCDFQHIRKHFGMSSLQYLAV